MVFCSERSCAIGLLIDAKKAKWNKGKSVYIARTLCLGKPVEVVVRKALAPVKVQQVVNAEYIAAVVIRIGDVQKVLGLFACIYRREAVVRGKILVCCIDSVPVADCRGLPEGIVARICRKGSYLREVAGGVVSII